MKHEESKLQMEIVSALQKAGVFVISVPNERNLGVSDALRMRAMGLTKGAPDLIVYTDHWIWLELKTKKGVRSVEQECFETKAIELGVEYRLVKQFESIKDLI